MRIVNQARDEALLLIQIGQRILLLLIVRIERRIGTVERSVRAGDGAVVLGLAPGVIDQRFESVAHRAAQGRDQRVVPGIRDAVPVEDHARGRIQARGIPRHSDALGERIAGRQNIVRVGRRRRSNVPIDEYRQMQSACEQIAEREADVARKLLLDCKLAFMHQRIHVVRDQSVRELSSRGRRERRHLRRECARGKEPAAWRTGGVKIRFGNVSAGQVVGTQLKVC